MQNPRVVEQKVCARPKVYKQLETHDIHVLFIHALADIMSSWAVI